MSNIALSKKELTLINYRLAFIRSRKFDIKEKEMQNFIRKTFYDAILMNYSDRESKLISTIQRSLFPLIDEDKAGEKINPKEEDFFLLSIFFECLLEQKKNGIKIDTVGKELFVRNGPTEILLKGFCELIETKICKNSFFKKQEIQDREKFLESIFNILNEIKEAFEEKKHKTWINKTIKHVKDFSKESLENERKEKLTTETKQEKQKENQVAVVKEEKPKEKKAFSKMNTLEVEEVVNSIIQKEKEINEKEDLEFVEFILKSEQRIDRFIRRKEYEDKFYKIAFKNNIPFILPTDKELSEETKERMVNHLIKKGHTKETDLTLMLKYFDKEKFDEISLTELFLRTYKKNSYEYVENVFLKEKVKIKELEYPHQSNNFLFYEVGEKEDEAILHYYIISEEYRKTSLVYKKENFEFVHKKESLETLSKKDGKYIPTITSSWKFYKNFVLENYDMVVRNLNEVDQKYLESAKHFLSTMQLVDIEKCYSEKLLQYKILNYEVNKEEIFAYIGRLKNVYDRKKIFLNKKMSERILTNLINHYSSLSNVQKYNLLYSLDEVIVLDWLKVLDPVLIEVASMIELPIADSVQVILNNLSEVRSYAQFGRRSKIEY